MAHVVDEMAGERRRHGALHACDIGWVDLGVLRAGDREHWHRSPTESGHWFERHEFAEPPGVELLRIVQALVGDPMTPLQLRDRLGDVPQATLYRHINQLAGGGLLEVVGERRIRGGIERTYRVVTSAVVLGDDELESATPDEHRSKLNDN